MERQMTMTCGQQGHDEECVCDVRVGHATEIAPIDPERYWGMRIALDSGMTLDSPEEILDLLEALARAKDAAVNMRGFDREDTRGVLRASVELKNKIEDFLRQGNSIVDAPRHFCEPWANCVAAITGGRPSVVWSWPESFWAQIEDFICTQDEWCGYRRLMREFSIERGAAQTLERLYRDAEYAERTAALRYARSLLIQSPRCKRVWVIDKCAKAGYTVSEDDVTSIRSRLREAGLMPARSQSMADWRATHG